ncbi:MAG: AmmeMemoRadiSam system protein A [Candidatus Delongbacteria bacterium]|nr:AmmeMemoRadiSam system protein A [Candidatus Delongbacteria bacterium]MDY0017314.1 AmmeMemoRadiSam system protein A [Candidatus Delongbacteria bacterium]
MKEEVKKYLLKISRLAILSKFDPGSKTFSFENIPDEVKINGACFVTLTINGELRGCIGSMEAYRPLYEDVIAHSGDAAFRDPRFPPLSAGEVPSVKIEISVLTPRQEVSYSGFSDLKNKIIPHRHGVYLSHTYYSSTFLPQVWEQLSSHEEFFSHLCHKAGLDPDFILDHHPKIEIYTVENFKEE